MDSRRFFVGSANGVQIFYGIHDSDARQEMRQIQHNSGKSARAGNVGSDSGA